MSILNTPFSSNQEEKKTEECKPKETKVGSVAPLSSNEIKTELVVVTILNCTSFHCLLQKEEDVWYLCSDDNACSNVEYRKTVLPVCD